MISRSSCISTISVTRMSDFGKSIVFDNDSYYNYMQEEYPESPDWPLLLLQLSGERRERRDLIYFVLRSVASVGRDADEETLGAHQLWRNACIRRATELSFRPEFHERPPLPTWAQRAVVQVRDQLRPLYPQVDAVEVIATFDPRLHVRAYHTTRQIHVSLLTRELLRLMDLSIWNAIATHQQLRRKPEAVLPGLNYDYFLPFLLPLYREISWALIPMMRLNSELAGVGAATAAGLQMTFMIAHEFAHLLLHDDGMSGPELEIEADRFAYDVLFRAPGENITVGDVWMAVRWLFEILSIENLMAWRLSGSNGTPNTSTPSRHTLIHPFARSVGPSLIDLQLGGAGLQMLLAIRGNLEGLTAEAVRKRAALWTEALTTEDVKKSERIKMNIFGEE